MNLLIEFLLIAPPILIALTFHEYAHAFVANLKGDPTAKEMGRLTLNPFVHLDLLGTAMLFIVHIGWAKPVPVNPNYFRDPKRDMLWVSLAGPVSNLLLALFFGILCRILGIQSLQIQEPGIMGFIQFIIAFGLIINIVLAIFNLLPIPPLDGSKILLGILPQKLENQIEPLFKFGTPLLILLIVIGYTSNFSILWSIINPFVKFFTVLFAGSTMSL